ncbi:MAG: hypothetical protein LBJ67_05530 [Planctomycetaceae bacterium]|jgi:Tfp pilus assembly PilM family ATPase|nr:hypothetical protein [Planctomycetaceae bacterium]
MPHWIAAQWDKNQILILTARTKKGKTFYEKAVRILPDMETATKKTEDLSVPSDDEVFSGFTLETVKKKLRHFVQQERLGKYDTVVVLGRDEVEVRSMLFPPVPNDELPEMAKFQASKEFTEYEHTAALDFVLFDGARRDKKHILASILPKPKQESIESIISSAGLNLQRIVLGPCESAKRFATITVQQKTGGAGKTTLFVEIGELSATLVLLYRGNPAFVRTAHFSKSVWAELADTEKRQFEKPEEIAKWKWLTSEFKRTIVAAINDVPSEKVDEIVLCGVGEHYEKLLKLLTESLATPVSLFNVWRFENRDGEIKNHLPVFEEQFMPLIGALTAAAAEKPNTLDFKNPKHKPENKNNRNLMNIIVVAIVLLIFLTTCLGYYRRTLIEKQLQTAHNKEQQLVKATASSDQHTFQESSLAEWKKGNVSWLKEIDWLASNLPSSQDILLTNSLSLTSPTKGNAVMTFSVNTRGTTVVPQLEQKLRDDTHSITAPNIKPATNGGAYTHSVDKVTVSIIPPKTQPRGITAKTSTQQPAAKTTASPPSPISEELTSTTTSEKIEPQIPPLNENSNENPEDKKEEKQEQPQQKTNGSNNVNSQNGNGGAA